MSIRLKTVLVLVLSALTVYLGLVNVSDRLRWQGVSEGLEWGQTSDGLKVIAVSEALRQHGLPLSVGDLLVSVNGISVGNRDDLTEIHEFLAENLSSAMPLEYRFRTPQGKETDLQLLPTLESSFRETDILLLLLAFGYLLIGLFIFLCHGKAAGAFHFYVICLVAFMAFLFRHSGRADGVDVLIYCLNAAAFLALPPLFVHFCLRFPQSSVALKRRPWLRGLLYFPALLLVMLHGAWLLGWLQLVGFPRAEGTGRILDWVELSHFVVFFLAGSLVLRESYRASESPVQRQQSKWITHGSLLGLLPFLCLYGIPYLSGFQPTAAMEASILGLILIPLGFAYAITRYRLMDVDLIVKRSATYLLASAALLGTYVLLVVLIGSALHGLVGEKGVLLFALSALLVAMLFAPLKNRIQQQIDRYFYKDRYNFRRSLAKFGQTLNSEINLFQLASSVCDRVQKMLDISPVAVFLRDEAHADLFRLYQGIDIDPEIRHLPVSVNDVLRLRTLSSTLDSIPARLQPVVDQLKSWRLQNIHPLRIHDRVIGFLALGPRDDGRLPSSEDLQLVDTLAEYAAVALGNAVLYRSLESGATELAELKIYNENVIESLTVGIAVISPEGEITIWNSCMGRLYGLAKQDVLGRPLEEVFSAPLVNTLKTFFSGPHWEISEPGLLHKTHLETSSGETRLVNLSLAPFVSADHINTGTLLIFDDITERVQLEQKLSQAEKLSSIGLFAAGVAHEVNTPLAGISSYVQMMIQEMPEDDSRRQILKKVEAQTFRASKIISNLLNFARVSDSEFSKLNLNSVMTDTVSLLDHPLKKAGVEVHLDLDPSLPPTLGSSGKLQQVFMNLVLNARDSMPQGGQVRVRTYASNSSIVIEVEDEGQGISRQDIKRVYDPFFTSKEVGEGIGLGLSVSYGIVQEHSGQISVDSQPGKGTTFRVELPVKRLN